VSDLNQDNTAPQSGANTGDNGTGETGAEDQPRVRFSGIVEKPEAETALHDDVLAGFIPVTPNERRWNAMSRQVWQVARLTAVFVFFSIIAGLPLGNYLAHQTLYGSAAGWSLLEAYPLDVLLLGAFIVPVLIVLCGYLLSKQLTMMTAAESIAAAAQQFVTPDITAAQNANTVGAVVQGHVAALNAGLDGALSRLASVEAMIRQHVEAIEIAGEAIEHRATGAVGRVADERARLMELTENLNSHADSFAIAIAERAKTGVEAMQKADTISLRAENEFDERLTRLEGAAQNALTSFESLRDALRVTEETMRGSAGSIDKAAEMTLSATKKATNIANAAAEAAALNAANVIASANRASSEARKAADGAIETAAEETLRISQAAIDAAKSQSAKVQDAAAQTLEDVAKTTREAIDGAVDEAAKAARAASDVAKAARKTSEAATKASADVAQASERAKQTSDDALAYSESAAARIEERNQALASARADLEQENTRLESLIDEQRTRADRLANAIASQTERLSRLAEAQLREQEAAARIAEAQNEMQVRAQAQQTAEAERAAALKIEPKPRAGEAAHGTQERTRNTDAAARRRTPKSGAGKETAEKARNGAGRLDELARDIAERRSPSSSPAKREPPVTLGVGDKKSKKSASLQRDKKQISWKEILDAADEAEPLDLGLEQRTPQKGAARNGAQEDEAARAIKIISGLQGFTYDLETRLYGDPPPAMQERFNRGDRNVFANRLLRLNEVDVKRRIRTESGRDKEFERGVHDFLQGFEKLLEDATTSETADEELEEYLSSPLGRVYLLIGATVGYFA